MIQLLIWIIISLFIKLAKVCGNNLEVVYVKLHTSATLNCDYRSTTAPFIWRGPPNLTPYSINGLINKEINQFDRLSLKGDSKNGQYSLTIHNFTKTDCGKYRCDTAVENQTTEKEFELLIAEPPVNITVYNVTKMYTIEIPEGSPYTIQCCVIGGVPPSKISWILEDETVVSNKTCVFYTFVANRAQHQANLTCIADNDFYRMDKEIQLHIYLRPRVNVVAEPLSHIEEGNNLTLGCKYFTNVKPVYITWTKDKRLIKSQNNDSFHISSVKRYQAGNYGCCVQNSIGFGKDSIEIKVNYKPYMTNGQEFVQIESHIGIPSNISLTVGSEALPRVSWLGGGGGKKGVWEVFNKSADMFTISSTIMPTEKSHLETYSVRIRNSFGSIIFKISLVQYIVNTYPKHLVCNTSSTAELSCEINTENTNHITNVWEHVLGTTIIRRISGNLMGNKSILRIPYCDYKDAGDFVCKWTSSSGVYESTSTIVVNSHPILTRQSAVEKGNTMTLEVKFYSNPGPKYIFWYYNDKLITDEVPIERKMQKTKVNLLVYKTLIIKDGYVAFLTVDISRKLEVSLFGCQVKNAFGYLDTVFANQTYSTSTCCNPTRPVGVSEWKVDRTYVLVGSLSGVILIAFIIFSVVCCRHAITKAQKKKIETAEVHSDDRANENSAETNSFSSANNPSYEEIDSLHFQSVDWQNAVYEGDVEEQDIESSDHNVTLQVPANYNGLHHEGDANVKYGRFNQITANEQDITEYLDVI